MKKIVKIILLTICLSGCTPTNMSGNKKAKENDVFIEIERITMTNYVNQKGLIYIIYYHKETKVMYIVNASNDGIFTVLLNPDGTPMIYEGD